MISTLKILILEDEDILRFGIETILKRAGFKRITSVNNIDQALSSIKASKPDIAVLDIMIEGTSEGFLVASELRKKNVPFIFLTGSTATEIIDEAISLEPLAYLIKPINTYELVANLKLFVQCPTVKENISDTIFIKSVHGHTSLVVSDILYISCQNVYLEVFLKSGKKVVVRAYINNFLNTLNDPDIMKVHRSYAVNLKAISSINKSVITIGKIEIPISKSFKDELYKKLGIDY